MPSASYGTRCGWGAGDEATVHIWCEGRVGSILAEMDMRRPQGNPRPSLPEMYGL